MKACMKCVVVCLFLLLGSVAAWSSTTFNDIEEKTGWGSCVACAGGASKNASIATSPFHTSPSKDGASRDFYINGSAWADALWWKKLGAHNSATHFQW